MRPRPLATSDPHRWPDGPDPGYNDCIKVRLHPEEWAAFRRRAGDAGMKVREYALKLVLDDIYGAATSAGTPPAKPAPGHEVIAAVLRGDRRTLARLVPRGEPLPEPGAIWEGDEG